MDMQEKYRQQLDISYSYHLAKRMEKHRTNEELGYRTAGSKAELATGEMLEQEMRTIGFPIVHKDAITVDAWEFERAKMTFLNEKGEEETIQLGAYQTNFVTDGPECYSVVYAGRGTLQDYEGMDVTGKLVLVDINQRDEWWINYPVYQAHLKGAAALIAVQSGGYGEIDDEALNAQDIAGPEDAPAFSVEELEEAMQKVMDEYAGGIASNYQFNEKQLALADEKILQLQALAEKTAAADMHELMFAYELRERLIVCRSLIAHLKNRKETRWHSFNENLDYPETDEKFYKYVNSKLENGEIRMIFRDIVKEDTYEHTN